MAQVFACTFFFENTQSRGMYGAGSSVGWSETWYRSFDNIENALANCLHKSDFGPALDQVDTYLQYRLPLMSPSYAAIWARVSGQGNAFGARLVKAANIDPSQGTGTAFLPANSSDAQTTCALLIDFTSVVGTGTPPAAPFTSHRRSFLLRGLPGAFTVGNIFAPSAAYNNSLIQFTNFLTRHANAIPPVAITPWLIRWNNAAPAAPLIGAILPPPPAAPRQILVPVTLLPFVMGQRVRVSRETGVAYVNRQWTAVGTTVQGGVTYTVLGQSRRDLLGTFNGTGFLRVVAPQFTPCTNFAIIGLRVKKTGRPSHPLRGRRRAG